MAKNPMQRKAQNSFLLGMFITLLITGIVIVFLFMQLSKMTKEQKEQQARLKDVYVLSQDINSGDSVTADKLKTQKVDSMLIPSNPLTQAQLMEMQQQIDDNGNVVKELNVVSKINLKQGTILTSDMVSIEGELTSDLRRVEYNMIELSSQLETDKYIDIRMRLPNGADYTVVTHKKVTIPEIDGVPSLNTISLNLSEIEILTISGAIIECYQVEGAMLYATEYVEPGLQGAATVTYVPDNTTLRLIQENPNCVSEARQALWNRLYNSDGNMKQEMQSVRQPVNNALNSIDSEDKKQSLNEKVEEEVQTMQEQRQSYLESLGGTY